MELKKTVEYFTLLADLSTSSKSVPWTPFHTALVKGNMIFLNQLFEAIKRKSLRTYICNTTVDYSTAWHHEEEFIRENLKDVARSEGSDFMKYFIHSGNSNQADERKCGLFKKGKKDTDELKFEIPIALACISGNHKIIEFLLTNGASLGSKDSTGNTVFHSLVSVAKYQPLMAVSTYRELVNKLESVEEKHDLVRAENVDGKTALDLAAKELCFDYVLALYQTEGVYRFVSLECGAVQHVLYDISRYESATSTEKVHFLHNLAMIHEDEIPDLHRCKILENEPFKSWFTCKLQKYRLKCVIWYLIWVILLGLFSAQTILYYSSQNHPIHKSLAVILLIYAALISFETILFIISERNVYFVTFLKSTKKGFPVANKSYYMLFHLIFATTVVVIEILHIIELPCDGNIPLYVSLYVFASEYGCLSLMLFTQLYAKGGHLVTLIDRMVWDVFLSLLIWVIIFNSFILSFYILHTEPICEVAEVHSNNTIGTNKDMFSTFKHSFYETILLALEILPPKPLHFDHASVHWLAVVLYSSFLLLVPLVLINLIIAIMTQKVSALNRYQNTIQSLQKLFLALFMERISSFRLIPINPFKSMQNKVESKHLVFNEDGTQIFIEVVEKIPHLRKSKNSQIQDYSGCTHL